MYEQTSPIYGGISQSNNPNYLSNINSHIPNNYVNSQTPINNQHGGNMNNNSGYPMNSNNGKQNRRNNSNNSNNSNNRN